MTGMDVLEFRDINGPDPMPKYGAIWSIGSRGGIFPPPGLFRVKECLTFETNGVFTINLNKTIKITPFTFTFFILVKMLAMFSIKCEVKNIYSIICIYKLLI